MTIAQTQAAFAAHLRDPASNPAPLDIEDRRMQIYRDLFYNNVENFIASGFPVLRKLHTDEAWHAMVREFFSKHESHTPYFPKLCEEFLLYLEHERDDEQDPPWMFELAQYEWVEAAVHISDAAVDFRQIDRNGDLLTCVPVLSPTAWLLQYRWPVHTIRPDNRPLVPPAQPTWLVVYRNREDEVCFLEINAVTARLVQLLQENEIAALGCELLSQLGQELGQENPETIQAHGLTILNQLREREILLGTQKQSAVQN